MSEAYESWLELAGSYNIGLSNAIKNENQQKIIYYRGKYIHALKQAYKLDKNGVVPTYVSNTDTDVPIADEIKNQLNEHQIIINSAIKNCKKSSDIKKPMLIHKEIGLKLRRLSTKASQISFKSANPASIMLDATSLIGTTLIKAPIMISSKIISKVGPLAISIISLPLSAIASLLAVNAYSISDDKDAKKKLDAFQKNTPVKQLSDTLKDAIKDIASITYSNIGKI